MYNSVEQNTAICKEMASVVKLVAAITAHKHAFSCHQQIQDSVFDNSFPAETDFFLFFIVLSHYFQSSSVMFR